MGIGKTDFISVINHYKMHKDRKAVNKFLIDVGVHEQVAHWLIEDTWGKRNTGSSIYHLLFHRGALPDMTMLKLRLSYVVETEPYKFENPK